MNRILAILLLTAWPVLAAEGPLPNLRCPAGQTNWAGLSGVPDGIPSTNRTHFTNFTSGASMAAIQAALNACPSNQIVFLGDGSYTFSGYLTIANSGVTLLGAGSNTFVNLASGEGILIGNTGWYNNWASPVAARHVDWTNGFAAGSTTIAVTNVGDLTVGELVFLDMKSDSYADADGACGIVGSGYSSVANPSTGQDRYQFQLNRVTNIVGNTLYLSDPVYMTNYAYAYTNALQPQVWWYGSAPVVRSGIQNLTLLGAVGGQGIYLQNAYACWIKDVNVFGCRMSMNTMVALRCEFSHNLIGGTKSTSDDYHFQLAKGAGLLVENNILAKPGTLILNGVQGSVISYNYLTNVTGQPGWMQGGIITHGGNPNMNLFEGNSAPGWWVQNCWGSSEYNVAFRNRFRGVDEANAPTITGDIEAVCLTAQNPVSSCIGNVLGTAGVNDWYEDTGTNYVCHSTSGRVFVTAVSVGGCGTEYDAATYDTFLRILNWDSANSSIVDSNGWTVAQLPDSLYLASRPSWFGNLTWPAVNPANPTYSASITNVPSGYRLIYGADPPSATQVETPTFSPAAGSYESSVEVTLSCATGGAAIYYTVDGSTPSAASTLYSAPFTRTSTTTVKAIGILAEYDDSAVASAIYTITTPTPAASGSATVSGALTVGTIQ
jgi:hypothetical protein